MLCVLFRCKLNQNLFTVYNTYKWCKTQGQMGIQQKAIKIISKDIGNIPLPSSCLWSRWREKTNTGNQRPHLRAFALSISTSQNILPPQSAWLACFLLQVFTQLSFSQLGLPGYPFQIFYTPFSFPLNPALLSSLAVISILHIMKCML